MLRFQNTLKIFHDHKYPLINIQLSTVKLVEDNGIYGPLNISFALAHTCWIKRNQSSPIVVVLSDQTNEKKIFIHLIEHFDKHFRSKEILSRHSLLFFKSYFHQINTFFFFKLNQFNLSTGNF